MSTDKKPQHAPVRQALGPDWSSLGESVRRHYDLPPHTDTQLEVEGIMEVTLSPIGKLFVTVGRLFDALVPFKGKDIPVTVRNWSKPGSKAMFWHRTFRYPGRDPITFQSHMVCVGDKHIVEYVKYGLGLRMKVFAEGKTLCFESQGYQWDLGLFSLAIPDWLMLGRAIIQETPISKQAFKVNFNIRHPLWGHTFGYTGQFRFQDQKGD